MIRYLAGRLLAAIPTLIGVNALTFALFFVVNPPERMAKRILGERRATPERVQSWLRDRGYDRAMFYASNEVGVRKLTETMFVKKSAALLWFDFGTSDRNNIPIGEELRRRMVPSLTVTVPLFVLALAAYLTAALVIAYARGTYLDGAALVVCVLSMSVSTLFYIVGGQWVLAKWLHWLPISGYDAGVHGLKFVLLPVAIGVAAGAGASIRFYRAIFLEELGKDYVRTARAKGLGTRAVLFGHALRNALIPILTNEVTAILFLFTGSLLLESFFGIPGLGSFTIDAISAQDFAIVRAMVYLGSVLYITGLILTDVAYTVVDPRVRLQ